MFWFDRPGNVKVGVVPEQTKIMSRRIVISDRIDHFRIRCQGTETVGKSNWHKDLVPLLRRDLDRRPLPAGRRGTAKIDGHIQDASARDPHELVLGERRGLKMQTTD